MAWKTTRTRNTGPRRRRNTAPMWKKFTVVLSAPIAVLCAISLLHASGWSFLPFAVLIVGVAAAAVWLMSRLLGIHLGLRSWD